MKLLLTLIVYTNVYLLLHCTVVVKSGNTTLAPFGAITGYASTNVPAYSNGNDSYTSNLSNYLYGVYTGMPWQCVEYARRWLFIRKGCLFDSVEGAADIWTNITEVQRMVDGRCFSLKKYPNGFSQPPINESFLIYNRSDNGFPFGHVAVIVDVLPSFIRVAEENYDSYYWSGNYSRQISVVQKNGGYYIEDGGPILGWMSVEDNNQTKPLDQTTISAIMNMNQSFPDFICSRSAIGFSFSIQTSLFLLVSYAFLF